MGILGGYRVSCGIDYKIMKRKKALYLDSLQGDTVKFPKDFWLYHWMTFEELCEAVGKGLKKKCRK